MRTVITSLLLGFIVFGLVGCGSQKRVVVAQPKVLPSWYTRPMQSNATDLYAVGEGKDKKEAISNALAQMISTLSVSISSDFSAKTVVKEGSVNSSEGVYTNEVHSDVKQIRISNYELLQAESLGFKKYAVLVKSNKQKLFESMKQELDQRFEIIAKKESTLKEANMLKQLSFYKKAKDSLVDIPNTFIVMSVLKSSFDSSEYLQKMQYIHAKYESTVRSISFSIHSDKNAVNLKAPVAKGLSSKKLRIGNGSGKSHFNIYISSKIEQAASYGFSLARSEVSIVTMESSGTIIGSNALQIVGQSSQGFDIAKQNVAFKLNALIEKEGIAKVTGLDI